MRHEIIEQLEPFLPASRAAYRLIEEAKLLRERNRLADLIIKRQNKVIATYSWIVLMFIVVLCCVAITLSR